MLVGIGIGWYWHWTLGFNYLFVLSKKLNRRHFEMFFSVFQKKFDISYEAHLKGCQRQSSRKHTYVIYLFIYMEGVSGFLTKPVRKSITKTYLYNFDPLKPHFYIVKLGFTGVYIIFLISAQNIDCGYSLEPPRRGGSNEYLQSMFCAEIWKISEFFIGKFSVLGDKIFYLFE